MKTKQFALMLLALAFIVSASATEIPKMNVIALDDSKALIAAVTSPNVASEISLVSADDEIVYYRKSKAAAQYKSILDLSELNDGMYTVTLKTGKVSAQRKLEVNQGKIQVVQMKREIDPFFSYEGDMVKLSYLNSKQNNISLLIYNGNQLVFQSKLGNNFNIQRAFDVSKMVKGEFNFVLTGTDQYCNYKINR